MNINFINYLIVATVLICDQLTKFMARIFLSNGNNAIELFWGHLKLQLTHNTGAFLGMGSNWSEPIRWSVLIVFVFFFLYFLWRMMVSPKSTIKQKICYAVVFGGGASNLIDRIAAGHVTDFLWIGFGPLQTGVFNIADMGILFGVLILLLEIHPKDNKKVI